ncbi:MAG: protein kinase [Ignavibacteriales bacterium]|nr:protein kinase [Ignavibacteriales bacterium]
MIGQTISHYKILEKLGEGGMGVVYKAHDTKLDRDVALKFLPHHLAATPDDQARFLQEARSASALNHPNICTIHDICLDPDQQYIVMECIDGKTLRQLIPIQKMQTAIEYAIQIGEVLQEAHGKGVVHHDVKTDNIMVNAKNQIKVMDFGLAKLKGSLRLTKTMSTAGTLAYMAPEQIQSGDVDTRSDIFSFGVVLYEMLTGHLPFRGEHEAAMMYSIVNEEPRPVQKYLPEASSELMHILNRALEKEPDERYQSVAEMVIDLRRLKKDTGRVFRTAPVAHHPEGMGESSENIHRRSRKRFAIILLAAVFIACAAAAIVFLSHGPQLNPDMKILDLQIPFQDVMYGSLSASGNSIVFPAADDQGKFDIYMMNVSTRQPIRITNDSSRSISGVSISPDEGTIAYKRTSFAGVSELVVTPIGGISKVIKTNVVGVCGFCDGGKRILYLTAMKCSLFQVICTLWSYALDGSDQKSLFADTAFSGTRWAYDLSANGRYVAWTKTFAEGFSEIMVSDLEKGTDRRLTFDKKFVDDVRWTPFGKIVYASDRGGSVNLWMISEQGGEPQQITRGAGPHFPTGISKDGKRLLYSEMQSVGSVKSMDLASGTVRQLSPGDRLRSSPAVSNSGRFIAFAAQDQDAYSLSFSICIADRDGKNIRKITDDVNAKFSLSWSPDDAQIEYSATRINDLKDSVHIYIVDPSRPGGQRQLMAGTLAWWWNAKQLMVKQDMRSYLYSIGSDHYERTPEDSVFAYPVLNNKYVVLADYRKAGKGLWIATMSSYQSNGAAKATSLVKPMPLRWARSLEGGDIYYLTAIGGAMYRLKLPGGRSERVKNVPPGFGVGYSGLYAFTVCGNKLVYTEFQTHTRYFIIDNLIK